jgi:UDP-N-acetylmuramoyl-tripeptide--D-alanyl-D-alanine ligase
MRAALDLLDELGRGRPRVAILGTMLELGAHTEPMHDQIAERALRSSIDVIAGVGAFATALKKAGGKDDRIVTAGDAEELWKVLEPKLVADAVILLKGSRGMKLERLVPMLRQWSERQTAR